MKNWKDVVGYEGLYRISDKGDIVALPKKVISSRSKSGFRITSERVMSQCVDRYGYMSIRLTDLYGDRKAHTIHRLVSKTFILNPNNLPCVNHIDENKKNNHVSNLEWCSVRYNNLYNGRQDKINEKLRCSNRDSKSVSQYFNDGTVRSFISIRDASRRTGVNRGVIKNSCLSDNRRKNDSYWEYN